MKQNEKPKISLKAVKNQDKSQNNNLWDLREKF